MTTTHDIRTADRRRPSLWASMNWTARVSLTVLLIICLASLFGRWIVPHDPAAIDPTVSLLPPLTTDPGFYLLGTDNLGRDIFSRLIIGARISILVGLLGVVVAGAIGVTAGILAGYFGGWVDAVLMRIVDAFLSIPSIVLILALLAILDPGVTTLIIVLGLTTWVIYARQVRNQVLEIRERLFVKAARTFGSGHLFIMIRHVLVNVIPTFVVLSTLSVATLIVTESSMSFLGLGIQPPDISWGLMLTGGRDYIATAWWVSTFPGLCITTTVLCILFVGDWLRERLDPRLKPAT
ncbi:ABC transporter permease [Microbacterium sp. gxy059]|uniref:ABC transporter permease n=1 Tax=Microbacterium sp. gxy059 TaxID=2957199 RepID=UPI003D98B5D2